MLLTAIELLSQSIHFNGFRSLKARIFCGGDHFHTPLSSKPPGCRLIMNITSAVSITCNLFSGHSTAGFAVPIEPFRRPWYPGTRLQTKAHFMTSPECPGDAILDDTPKGFGELSERRTYL
jgi:hypothetical protein